MDKWDIILIVLAVILGVAYFMRRNARLRRDRRL